MNARLAIGLSLGSAWLLIALWLAGAVALRRYGYPLSAVDLATWPALWVNYSGSRGELLEAAGIGAAVAALPVAALGIAAATRTRSLHGDARFATRREIRDAKLLSGEGIVLARYQGRYLTLPGQQSVALIAPTRSGKGVGVVVPNLLTWPDSVVVLDVKGENFAITSRYRAENGQAVFLFNPFSATTHRYNPLGAISAEPTQRTTDVLSIGYALYPRIGRDPIWQDTARNLFVGIVLFLLETPGRPVTLGEVLKIAAGDGRPVKTALNELINDNPSLSNECVEALGRFLSAPENTAGSILTTFTAPLTLWQSPLVDAATSASDVELSALRRRRMSIYLAIPANKLPEADVLLRLFFTQLVNANTDTLPSADPRLQYACLVLLDEAAAPGHLPILDKAVGYLSGYGLRLLTVFQSRGQVAKPLEDGGYGREGARTLLDNHAVRVMFTPKSLEDATELSELLGYQTVKARSRRLYRWGEATESDQRRALMMPQELLTLPATEAIVHLEGLPAIRAEKLTYYNDPTFMRRLASVSSLGMRPTREALEAAIARGELASPVPTLDLDAWQREKRAATLRPLTLADVDAGLELDELVADFSALPTHTGPMTDAEVDAFVEGFWDALGGDESSKAATPENALVDVSALE